MSKEEQYIARIMAVKQVDRDKALQLYEVMQRLCGALAEGYLRK